MHEGEVILLVQDMRQEVQSSFKENIETGKRAKWTREKEQKHSLLYYLLPVLVISSVPCNIMTNNGKPTDNIGPLKYSNSSMIFPVCLWLLVSSTPYNLDSTFCE